MVGHSDGFINVRACGDSMEEGLYTAEFHTVHGTGCGVVYAIAGKLRGGNSAFTFSGTYTNKGETIAVKVSTTRYNNDPAFKPLFGMDLITLTLTGRQTGNIVDFEGSAIQLPGVSFKAVLTRVGD